jgi:hypothetical protein
MVDAMLTTAAALCAASTLQQQKAAEITTPRLDLTRSESVRVQTERRRVARAAVTSSSTLDSLKPMIERAKADSAITEARSLLQAAERELRDGQTEQAMLTLDGAAMRLQQVGRYAESNTQIKNVFRDLESKETNLREKLGQPSAPIFEPKSAEGEGSPADADEKPTKVEPPKRDELPVG